MRLPTCGRFVAAAIVALCCFFAPASAFGWTGYVNNANSLVPFDTATDTAGVAIGLPGFVRGFAIVPDGTKAYVLVNSPNEIVPVGLPSGVLGTPIPLAYPPNKIAITPAGDRAYVASTNKGLVYPVDLRTDAAEVPIEVGAQAWGIALTPDASTAYVTTGEYPTFPASYGGIAKIDLRTRAVSKFTDSNAAMGGVSLTPDGRTVFSSNKAFGQLEITDAGTAARSTINTGYNAEQIAVAPNGALVAQSVYNNGTVALIDPVTKTSLGQVGVSGGEIEGVAITPDSTKAYGASYGKGTVTPIDLAKRTAAPPITIGGNADEVEIAPDQPPHAAFSAARVAPGQTTTFDASASTDGDSPIVKYEWDFGDGDSAITTGPTVTHAYRAEGSYAASVVETDAIGCSTASTLVYTGQMVSCNGSSLARAEGTAVVGVEPPSPPTPPSGGEGGSGSGGPAPGGNGNAGSTTNPPPPGVPGAGGPGAGGSPRLGPLTVQPAAVKVALGSSFKLAVGVSNRGDAAAQRLRICVAGPKGRLRLPKCVVLKQLPAGKTAKLRFKVGLAPGAAPGSVIHGRVTVTAPGLGAGRAAFRVAVAA